MSTEELERIIANCMQRRKTIKTQFTVFRTFLIQQEDNPDYDRIQTRVEAITEYFKEFKNVQKTLEEEEPEKNHEEKRFEIEESYYDGIAQARKLLRTSALASGIASDASERSTVSPITVTMPSRLPARKLPDLDPPTFDGQIEKWATFKTRFISMIDKNDGLSSSDKLEYLQSALSGKAARIMEALETTDNSYKDAWDLLIAKYDNDRKAILRHWAIHQDYPSSSKDTADTLDDLVVTFRQQLRSLTNLGQNVIGWDTCIISLILSKIGEDTAYQWELTLLDNKMPAYTTLLDFLAKRANCSDTKSSNIHRDDPKTNTKQDNKTKGTGKSRNGQRQTYLASNASGNNSTNQTECAVCKEAHYTGFSPKLQDLSVEERIKAAQNAALCLNCFRSNHKTRTSTIHAKDSRGNLISCRTLIDTCSMDHFMTVDLANTLGLTTTEYPVNVGALNNASTTARGYVTATIQSRCNDYQRTLTFLTIPQISNQVPDVQIDRSSINIPSNISLADPEFHKPAPVQMLIGTGTALSLLCIGQVKLSKDEEPELYLQKILLGWVIGGEARVTNVPRSLSNRRRDSEETTCHLTNIEGDMTRFWNIEEHSNNNIYSMEETNCKNHYNEHTIWSKEGRFIVALPFNDKRDQLGESRHLAMKRLESLRCKFHKDPDLKRQYVQVIQEYKELGHMRKASGDPHEGFYLPHHAVIKTSSLTTKVRVVFDGSAHSTTGISLNDALMVGPTIQDDIFSLLLRFRLHQYVLTGDIEKMYRQVLVREQDRKYQRILWYDEGTFIPTTYELNTVTFGLAPAPYLATKCLHKLADEEAHRFPKAATVLKRDLYVDDALTGADTIDEAIQLRDELIGILKAGGFNLRQCASNSPELLHGLPNSHINLQLQGSDDPTLKTLGVYWNSSSDSIIYTVKPIDPGNSTTKRRMFSEIARIFDPLGLLQPIIVTAKLLIQELWMANLNWDESVPQSIHTEWCKYTSQLTLLNEMSFDRKILLHPNQKIQLRGFCDASLKAYGACIYIRSADEDGNIHTRLLCSKSPVAPMTKRDSVKKKGSPPLTIDRLELCGAVLLSNLYQTIINAMKIPIDQATFWCNSRIVLYWLNKPTPQSLKIFAANRVMEIQRKTDVKSWRYVPTYDNSADLLTRGELPKKFLENEIWKQGPTWLKLGEETWPNFVIVTPKEDVEVRKTTCLKNHTSADFKLLEKYSSINKLRRIIAYCLRFKYRTPESNLSVSELEVANQRIIKLTQATAFSEELHAYLMGKPLPSKSRLLSLNPFLDGNGILRVGGRIQHASITYDEQHPMILPKGHYITDLIIQNEHRNNLHSGVQATLYRLRMKYWPIDGRNQVRKIVRRCTTCFRVNPTFPNYLLGNLPRVRVTATRPFLNTGVDYCGPFYIKEKKLRNRNRVKVYVAVFTCLSVKAVHLEVVSDMTTEGFLAALNHFISRRGRCASIYSDNGSNFKGAKNELEDLYILFQTNDFNYQVSNCLTEKGIEWKFIPHYHHISADFGNQL